METKEVWSWSKGRDGRDEWRRKAERAGDWSLQRFPATACELAWQRGEEKRRAKQHCRERRSQDP